MGRSRRHESKSTGVGCLLLVPGFFVGLDALTDMGATAPQSWRLFAEILGWLALYVYAAHRLGLYLLRGVRRKHNEQIAIGIAIAAAMTLLPVVLMAPWMPPPLRMVIGIVLQIIGVTALVAFVVATVLYLRTAIDPKRDRRRIRRRLERLGLVKHRSRRHRSGDA